MSQAAIKVNAAKITATNVGLVVTTRVFEAMGARATSRHFGMDRFWRNMRTLTLHDPVEMRTRTVGRWYLDAQPPPAELST
jgi:alkylation response protein AidB-like acyl-CoA dehydrogenase